MWPFSKKLSIAGTGILEGFTDWHSHILPGVDDGVQNMEDSVAVLKMYEKMGVDAVWLTPHIMEDFPNATSSLKERWERLKESYAAKAGPRSVKLHLAAENMIDSLFVQRLKANDLLPLSDGRLLVETSYFHPPMDFYDILAKIKSNGYYPVLAHPERYYYMKQKDYDRLLEMGVIFQLNLLSLVGAYGEESRKRAFKLLKMNAYSIAGSDLHSGSFWVEGIGKKTIPSSVGDALKRLRYKIF